MYRRCEEIVKNFKLQQVLIEKHNLDLVKCANSVIDLGPEGTPGQMMMCESSLTNRCLREYVKVGLKTLLNLKFILKIDNLC